MLRCSWAEALRQIGIPCAGPDQLAVLEPERLPAPYRHTLPFAQICSADRALAFGSGLCTGRRLRRWIGI